MNKYHFSGIGITFIIATILVAPIVQSSFAHQRALFEINGKDYLFIVGSANEPIFVDDKTNVVLEALSPNATNPTDSNANGTQPITGLEDLLKVEILAGSKNMTSNFEPAFGEIGNYDSDTFYPTVATTFDYRIYGNINGTDFDYTFTCTPQGEQSGSDNSTVDVSENVVRKALIGGFGCPDERTGFPEPISSQYEINQQLNNTSS
jgi:hypothetical protein